MSDSEASKQESTENEEESVFETDSGSDDIEKLKEGLLLCNEEKQNYLDGWQRSKADFVNLKKRSEEESKLVHTRAAVNFVESLLPTLDSFDMAFKDKDAWESAPEQWRKGVEYIHNQLTNVLDTYSVQKIGSTDDTFDHELHEPVETIEVSNEHEDNKVIEVVRVGYKIKDTVIRPAHVKVAHFSKDS